MTQAESFEQFYSNFYAPSVEWALGMFKDKPFSRRYTPQADGTQEIVITWPDLSVYRTVEKIEEREV